MERERERKLGNATKTTRKGVVNLTSQRRRRRRRSGRRRRKIPKSGEGEEEPEREEPKGRKRRGPMNDGETGRRERGLHLIIIFVPFTISRLRPPFFPFRRSFPPPPPAGPPSPPPPPRPSTWVSFFIPLSLSPLCCVGRWRVKIAVQPCVGRPGLVCLSLQRGAV